MSRVIQDSDDEAGLSDASPIRPVNDGKVPTGPLAEQTGLAPPAASVNGTSSSEKLRQELQQAHNAMFEPSPSAGTKRPRAADEIHPVNDLRTSSPVKRTKTASALTAQSPKDLSPSSNKKKLKRAKTYAERPSTDFGAFNEGPQTNDIWDIPLDQPVKKVKSARLESLSAGVPFLEVYKADEQQTVAPMDTLHSKTFQPSPLDSSAFISPSNVSDPFTQTFNSPSMQLPHMMGEGFENHEPNVMFPSSTIPATSSSVDKKLASSAADPALGDHNGVSTNKELDDNEQNDVVTRVALEDTFKLDKRKHEEISTQQHDDEHARDKTSSTATTNGKLKKRKVQLESDLNRLNSDDSIGLPKEMYKPRPSRSRSALIPENEGPASSDATQGRLKNPRRSKTVGGMSMETRQPLIEMGFSASQAENALVECDWVLEKAAELLIARAKSKSKSPEAVRLKAIAGETQVQIEQPLREAAGVVAEKEGVLVGNGITNPPKPTATGSPEVEAEEDWQDALVRKASGSAKLYKEQQAKQASQTAGVTDSAQSPSSNTKIKRTKSTKGRGRPKKSDAIVDEQQEEDELSMTAQNLPVEKAEEKVEQNAAAKSPTPDLPIEKAEKKGESAAKSEVKEESFTKLKLKLPAQPGPAQSAQANALEIDDDDSDGPPTASKIRRLKTAPAAALKKEKKKRGRPKKSDKVATEAKGTDESAHNAREKSYKQAWESQVEKQEAREALQILDKNAASASQAEDTMVEEKERLADTTKDTMKPSKKSRTKTKQPEPENSFATKTPEPHEEVESSKPTTPEKPVSASEVNITEKLQKAAEAKAAAADKKQKPGTHSPIKKQVSYRVGLSKHSRIEPLLKIKARPRAEVVRK